MNTFVSRGNIYKNGNYHPDHSAKLSKDMAKNKIPSMKQVKYRDDLYKFCLNNGIVKDFKLGRTRQNVHSNIRAFITIIEKNGLWEKFLEQASIEQEGE